MKLKSKIIIITISFILFFWVLGILQTFWFHNNNILKDELFTPDINELWMRIFTILLILASAIYAYLLLKNQSIISLEEKKLSLAVKNSPTIITITDKNGNIEYVNPKYTEITGWTFEEVKGKNPKILKSDKQPAEFYKNMWETINNGNQWKGEFCNKKKNGEFYWELASISALKDEKGEIISFIKVAEDITQQKINELKIKENEEKLSAVLENLTEGIISINSDGIIKDFNSAAENIFGYNKSEVIEKNVKMLMPEVYANEHDQYLKNYLSTGRKKIICIGREVEGKKKDGTIFPIKLGISDIKIEDKIFFTGIIQDITEEKRKTEELIMERKKAEIANRTKSRFLANMSHELRTPLNSIIGFTELLLIRKFGDLNAKQQTYLKNVTDASQHLLSLINDVLDLSKIEAGKMELDLSEFFLSQTIDGVLGVIKEMSMKKNLEINKEIEDNLKIMADKIKIKQILYNLISNSIKYTKESGKIKIVAKRENNFTKLIVEDTGIGIKKENFDKVFEEFKQVDDSYAKTQQGTGLGLSLTKRLVELHKGKIYFESEFGVGTTFFVEIPDL